MALTFSGAQRLTLAPPMPALAACTAMGWVQILVSASMQIVFGWHSTDFTQTVLMRMTNTERAQVATNGTGTGTDEMLPTRWYHMTIVARHQGRYTVYLNARRSALRNVPGTTTELIQHFIIGNNPNTGSNLPWLGTLGAVKLWNRALEPWEIAENMWSHAPFDPNGLLGAWTFHENVPPYGHLAGAGVLTASGGAPVVALGPPIPIISPRRWRQVAGGVVTPPAARVTRNTRAYPLGIQAGWSRRQGMVR